MQHIVQIKSELEQNINLNQGNKTVEENIQNFEDGFDVVHFEEKSNSKDLSLLADDLLLRQQLFNAVYFKDKQFVCIFCLKTSTQITNLLEHVERMYRVIVKLLIKKFKCSICTVKFARESVRGQHFRLVHQNSENRICVICTETFAVKFKGESIRRRHFKLVRKKAKHFECSICVEKFRDCWYLQEHIKKVHKGMKNFYCIICPKFFQQKCALWEHIKNAHKDTKYFKCSSCFKTFEGYLSLGHFQGQCRRCPL